MKVKLRIDSQVTEDSVSIEARLMTESIQELVHFAQHLGKEDKIHVKKEDEIYLLDAKEIHRVYTENRQVQVRTAKDGYRAQQALYQLLQVLPEYFLQISHQQPANQPPQADSKWSDSNISEKRRSDLLVPPLSQIH